MPQDIAPALDLNLTTRRTGNPDMVDSTRRPHFPLRSRIPGHTRSNQSLDPALSMVARLTQIIPQTMCRTRSPTIPAACRWCRHSRSIVPSLVTRTAGWMLLVEAPTLHPPTEPKNRDTTRHTLFPNLMMPPLAARRMEPPARPKSWALLPAKLQCTTHASMSPSPSSRTRLPLLPALLRLPVHRLKPDTVEVHIRAAATANVTATTDVVVDKEPRR